MTASSKPFQDIQYFKFYDYRLRYRYSSRRLSFPFPIRWKQTNSYNDSSLRRRNDRASGRLLRDVPQTKFPYLLKYGFELVNAIRMTHDQSVYGCRGTEVTKDAHMPLLATLSTNDPQTNNSPIKRTV